jgi:hypothetical protein
MHTLTKLLTSLPFALLALALASPASAEPTSLEALQRQVEEQNQRIERLETAVQELQSQPGQREPDYGTSPDDPLVGTWQCTNKVFTYNMTFFADGMLLQEGTSMGPTHKLSWKRLSASEILISGGTKVVTSMSGTDRMTAERQGAMTKWDCSKLEQ